MSDEPTDHAKALEVLRQGTPGPWTVEDPMGPDSLWVVQGGKPTHEWFPIAVVNMPDEEDHLFTAREAKANACNIAAVLARMAHPLSAKCEAAVDRIVDRATDRRAVFEACAELCERNDDCSPRFIATLIRALADKENGIT